MHSKTFFDFGTNSHFFVSCFFPLEITKPLTFPMQHIPTIVEGKSFQYPCKRMKILGENIAF
jgi:hypothetical protein